MNWVLDSCKKLILRGMIIVLVYASKIVICWKNILKDLWVKALISGIYFKIMH